MLAIRAALRKDMDLLKTLINEMGEYERLPVSLTEETLARDGFGPRQEFRVLIADLDNQPAGYAFFFNCYSTFRGRGLFLEDLLYAQNFADRRLAMPCFRVLQSSLATCRSRLWKRWRDNESI
jgi:hypothetical protein